MIRKLSVPKHVELVKAIREQQVKQAFGVVKMYTGDQGELEMFFHRMNTSKF